MPKDDNFSHSRILDLECHMQKEKLEIGCFGAITRMLNIVPKREDLLKVALVGPLAGFSVGFLLYILGFILPSSDFIGVIFDASVFHESFLAGGLAKLLLGDAISVNPLVIWAWAGLFINAINSILAGLLDGGRIAFSIWGTKDVGARDLLLLLNGMQGWTMCLQKSRF